MAGQHLLFAGGANFPDMPPWKNGKKVWHDVVYAIDPSDAKSWTLVGRLPRPLGYGVALSIPSGLSVKAGVLCCGGSDLNQHYRDCFVMRYESGKLEFETLPPLPKPCANSSGVILDGVVYVAGGIESPTSTEAMSTCWSMNLNNKPLEWTSLPTWPGPGRMLAVMSADESSLYLFSGAALQLGKEAKPVRKYLTDGYRYQPTSGWSKLATMPRATVAAPGPAPVVGSFLQKYSSSKPSNNQTDQYDQGIMILGGDDGTKVDFQPLDQHPGFPSTALIYMIQQDLWMEIQTGTSDSQVTTPLVQDGHKIIVPSGEIRPGVRTPKVRQLELSPRR